MTEKKKEKNSTRNKVIFGNCSDMKEVSDDSVHLVVTSPPYYNAPFDYPDLFESYEIYLDLLRDVAQELKRILQEGRIAAFVIDDTLIDKKKYPVVADITRIFVEEGFKYRERIVWVKPEGYIRISRRSGVLIQHPYPMYFYPDNLQESILLFQNGEFDYKSISQDVREKSKISIEEYQKEKWYLSVWNITNVLPVNGRLEKGIAAFPDEIAYRLITLFSYHGETVLDPFLGSGTTMKIANELERSAIGYEIDLELKPIIQTKVDGDVEIAVREDSKLLRTELQKRVSEKKK